MIKEKLQLTVGGGKVSDWSVLVNYIGDSRQFKYNAKNISKIDESQVKDFQVIHKSVIFPGKNKEEAKPMKKEMTKDQIRAKLEEKGITMSNNEFKATLKGKLLQRLQEAIAKSMASGMRPVINQLRDIVKAGGRMTRDQHKVYYKMAKNAAAKKYGIVLDAKQYVVGAKDKKEKFVRIFLMDEVGVLRVYLDKKPVWKRTSTNRVGDAILYRHEYNGMEEGKVTDATGTVKFRWDRSKYEIPEVRTEENKAIPVSIRKEEQLRIKAVIEEVFPSKKEEEVVAVSAVVETEDLPFDING